MGISTGNVKKRHIFIYESYKGKDVFFVATEEDAVAKLAGKN